MRLGYIILSHRDWRQVAHLAAILAALDPTALITISHDSRDPEGVQHLSRLDGVTVAVHAANRGEFGLVDRWLAAARTFQHAEPIDYLVVISGQDYPVVHPDSLKHDLADSVDGFLEYFDIFDPHQSPWRLGDARSRYFYRWRSWGRLDERWARLLRPIHAANRLQPWFRLNVAYGSVRVGRPGQGPPPPYRVYGGSQWHAISWRAVEHLVATLESTPELVQWARSSLVSDEAFFQTVLVNDSTLSFRQGSRRFYRFGESHLGHPAVLGLDDAATILDSDAWFARKLDWDTSHDLIELLDDRLLAHHP